MEGEIAMKIGEKIVENAIEPIGQELGYLFSHNNNVEELKNQVEKLGDTKQRVQHSVNEAKRKGEGIQEDVNKWLKTEESIVVEANKLVEDASVANTSWFNIMSRHQFGRKASEMAVAISKIEEEGKSFHAKGVSYYVPPQGIGNASVKGYEAFESRMSTLRGVIEALKIDNINTIGVYGMGGVGKTMLVKEVARQVKEDKLFDMVVMTVVSQTQDFKKMQGEIADMLGLKFHEESTGGRANKLQERLKTEKKILVIIDDIWEQLDLEAVGLSFGDDQKKCKLLFTSRFEDVLRDDMGIQENFHLGVLSHDEARNLFRKIVDGLVEDQDFDPVVVDIVKECAGLPIAITTVANALKNKKLHVWKDAVQQLRTSNPTNIKGMSDKVYHSIELSYDFLRNEEAQSLLLLCSLHEEDANINVDSLLRYGMGLDLFQKVYRLEQARDRVYTLVDTLKSSCLLLNGNRDDTVKMHDVIRDVAIHIAAKDKRMLVIGNADNLQEWSEKEKLKDSTAISLPYTDVCELPEGLECPQLKLFLLFNKKYSSWQITHPFFEGMKELRVLNLTKMPCPHLPSSLFFLQNLQTLCLDECELEDVALIGELKELKVLSLAYTNIKQLPEQIRKLTHLKVLDLSNCESLKVIPPNILSNLKMLEELYMEDSFTRWEVEGQSNKRSNARVTELDHLSRLTTLEIDIPSTKILPKALISEKLRRYKISIGYFSSEIHSFETPKTSTTLKLNLDISFQSADGIMTLLKSCKALCLGDLKGVQNILYELNSNGFPLLKHLEIYFNHEIQYIINSMGPPAFPVLESINLFFVMNLEIICRGPLAAGSFHNLREVEVNYCDKLKSVFSSSMSGCLPQLQRIEIKDCKVMGSIVGTEREDEIEISNNGTMEFPQLRSLELNRLPKLTCFGFDVESRGILFNQKVALPNLEIMKIRSPNNLRMIWHHQLFPNSFCKLKEVKVLGCESLKSLFPTSVAKRLIQQLEKLEIYSCGVLEDIVAEEEGLETEPKQFVFPRLTELTLRTLPELKSFYPGKYTLDCPSLKVLKISRLSSCDKFKMFASNSEVSFQETNGLGHGDITIQQPLFWIKKDTFANLEEIEISYCDVLKNLLSSSTAKSLVQLREMSINRCENIMEIVGNEGGECDAGDHPEIVFNQLTSLKLGDLPILTSFNPRNCKMIFPSLNRVDVTNCPELKIFSQGGLSIPKLSKLGIKGHNSQFCPINENDDLNVLFELNSDGCPLLKHLVIKQNYKIQYIINSMGRPQSIAFPILESICLDQVNNLENIYHGLLAAGSFRNLREVEVVCCNKLKFVFSSSMVGCLLQLQRIRITGCEVMGSIVGTEREDEIEISNNIGTMEFPQLRYLELVYLPELTCWFGCDVESRGILFNEKANQHFSYYRFRNLRELKVGNCDKLKYVFSSSMAGCLPQLQEIFIYECKVMGSIVGTEREDEIEISNNGTMEYFPQLRSLILLDLPELTCFGTTEFPQLRSLELWYLPELTCWFGFDVESRGILFNEKVALPNLEIMKIRSPNNLRMIWHHQLFPNSFCKLKEVKVLGCESLKSLFSTSVAKRLIQQLEKLEIYSCGVLEDIVAKEEGLETEPKQFVFPRLTELTLRTLPELKSFYPGKYTLDCPSLKVLKISRLSSCDKFKMFASNSEVSFQETNGLGHGDITIQQPLFWIKKDTFANLEEIEISYCDGLKNLLSSSTAKSLVQLREMSINRCENIMEIVGNEGGECDAGDHPEIVFNQLTSLKLGDLPILTSFNPRNCKMIFPSLNRVEVTNCPELKIFFQEVLSTPMLSTLKIDYKNISFYPEKDDLNNSVKQAWEKCNQTNEQSWEEEQSEEEQSWGEEESWEEEQSCEERDE